MKHNMSDERIALAKMVNVKAIMFPTIMFFLGLSLPLVNSASALSSDTEIPHAEAWKTPDDIDEDDYLGFVQKLIAGIVAFVIVVLAVCLILCFCCPICIIAKMRQRRGVVIRTGPGATTTTNGRTVTVTVNRSAAPTTTSAVSSPPVVAISNNYGQNKPYPVQESVTVVPLLQPQQPQYPQPQYPQPQYPVQAQPMNYPGSQQYPQSFELPPPYPGLPREADNTNLPYNPYYNGEGEAPSAPPPK